MSGIYVHLPFCRRRCSYCPFAISVDLRLRERYIGALVREIESSTLPEDAATLYFGGGTPSMSTKEELARILARLPARDRFSEVTLEANPEDIDVEATTLWRGLGVTRLSVGVQSLHDEELRPLGRLHGPVRAVESLRASVAAGFRTNADLIIGLPGQTRARFVDSLDGVLATGAGHLSLYVLDLDEDTPLRRRVESGRTSLPDEDLVVELYMEAVERCGKAGLEQYEISNFARPGEESRHNIGYWTRGPYVGFGLGAHSFDGRRRFANLREIGAYLECSEKGASTIDLDEEIGTVEAEEEEIFLSLRRREGIAIDRLVALRGTAAAEWTERGLEAGTVVRRGGSVAFTPRGFIVSSELIAELF